MKRGRKVEIINKKRCKKKYDKVNKRQRIKREKIGSQEKEKERIKKKYK